MPENANMNSKLSHLDADTDSSTTAIHHTLGSSPTQASPGSHRHDGTDSFKISFEDIEGAWMNIDGGKAYENFGGLPVFDGGSV